MAKIATILGMEVGEVTPKVAVVRCNGTCANRKKTSHYDGASTCAIEAALYSGETGCSYGCLGNGDCENACSFGAIHINPETRLPEVDEELCTQCEYCIDVCPVSAISIVDDRMFSDPNSCIKCCACVKECPEGARSFDTPYTAMLHKNFSARREPELFV